MSAATGDESRNCQKRPQGRAEKAMGSARGDAGSGESGGDCGGQDVKEKNDAKGGSRRKSGRRVQIRGGGGLKNRRGVQGGVVSLGNPVDGRWTCSAKKK